MRFSQGVAAAVVACGLVLGSAAGASADAGVVAGSVSAAPVQAAKKKALSGNAFAKKVATNAQKAAKKKVGSFKVTSQAGRLELKTSKKARWWTYAAKPGRNYGLLGDRASLAKTKVYRSAVVSQLKKAGLKNVGEVNKGYVTNGSQSWVTAYAGKKYVCTVELSQGLSGTNDYYTTAVSCVTRKQADASVKKATPFATTYLKANKKALGSGWQPIVAGATAKSKPSDSKKYRKYRKVSIYVGAVGSLQGGASAQYAKAPGKKWMFVLAGQGMPECKVYEKSRTASRAWAGAVCGRGQYGADMSKVRAH